MILILTCDFCGKPFEIHDWRLREKQKKGKDKVFCSKSCGSRGSVTNYRRMRAREIGYRNVKNLDRGPSVAARTLKSREGWKYEKVVEYLSLQGLQYEYEYLLPGTKFIFDLAIFDLNVLIEFDGPDHRGKKLLSDRIKEEASHEKGGWKVFRIPTPPNTIIDPCCVEVILDQLAG